MNVFGCLFPCALQHSWWSVGNEQCMTEEFTHRMGVNTSTVQSTDTGLVTSSFGGESCTPAYRDTMGAVRLVRLFVFFPVL